MLDGALPAVEKNGGGGFGGVEAEWFSPRGVRRAVGRTGARAATREEKGELGHVERGDEVAGGALASSAAAAGFSK